MRDLIDREAVMEIILMPQNVSIIEQLEMLKKLPSAQQWVSVTEGLPKKDGAYLVTVETHRERTKEVLVLIGSYVSRFKPFHWFGSVGKVTAWAPLPEPYKGGEV